MLLKSNNWVGKKYNLHYYSCGDPEKPALVFLHGFLGSGLDWIEPIRALADDFFCLAPDLPGHGKTRIKGSVSNYTMEIFASEFVQFIKQTGLGVPNLLGYSMGGRIALYIAVHYPQYLDKLILESSSPGLRSPRDRQMRLAHDENLARKLETININEFLADWYVQPIFSSLKENKGFQAMLERRIEVDRAEAARTLRMMSTGRQEPLWDELKAIKTPILLLAGDLDSKFSAIMKEMSEISQTAVLSVIKNAGHNIHVEQPSLFVSNVSKFLKDQEI
ncbi:MAG: 2-succinyl-6-hydroxy-2,4-cyclohexadiene-1-carboxylate synthase [Calditrichales bacterium]|nr:MAG: 2-succinyl-6-hydroxy-2,4-cyclohexadiene-1-carboxylate synthase [Calditrichales bacterium]